VASYNWRCHQLAGVLGFQFGDAGIRFHLEAFSKTCHEVVQRLADGHFGAGFAIPLLPRSP
jgi:hypothetical protein